MISLEVDKQTSSPFLIAGKIGMLLLKVDGQTSSPFLVAGETEMLGLCCCFYFNFPSSSRCNIAISGVYHIAGLASWAALMSDYNSESHPFFLPGETPNPQEGLGWGPGNTPPSYYNVK
ncbi:unnamed protein product [Cuscuta epithymum]|uniref:Uncharacterized protein n=1 Tax=Cuscuta epithymum TaxID=186058 RepID=A0AAV0DR38_9ASTE|nr:unnamed protein product [Cuscuta epithymum]